MTQRLSSAQLSSSPVHQQGSAARQRRRLRRGWRVALLARGVDGLHGAQDEVTAAGGEALAIPTDVADPGQVEAAAKQVERT